MALDEEFRGFKYAYEINPEWDNTATKVISLVGKGKRVLEFGCGPGHMSKVLSEKMGCDVTGIEVDMEAASSARRYCSRVVELDLDKEDPRQYLNGQKFDVLLFADVLEHLKDPWRLLSMAHDLLAEQGYIVASLPNVGYCGVLFELMSGRFDYRELGLLDRGHLRFFTRSGIKSMFSASGFIILDLDPL